MVVRERESQLSAKEKNEAAGEAIPTVSPGFNLGGLIVLFTAHQPEVVRASIPPH